MIFQLTNVVLNKRNRFEDGGTKRKIHHQELKRKTMKEET